jgi:hypothetical protein
MTSHITEFEGMIAPLTRSLRPSLILWYQGEANSNDPGPQYQCQMEALITEWRKAFQIPRAPFFLVQLAPYYEPPCPQQPAIPCGIGHTYPVTRIAEGAAADALDADGGPPTGYNVLSVFKAGASNPRLVFRFAMVPSNHALCHRTDDLTHH